MESGLRPENGRMQFAQLVCVATAIVLAGCGVSPTRESPPGEYAPLPASYKTQIDEWMKRSLFDPHSVQDFKLYEPEKYWVYNGLLGGGYVYGWRVPAEFNAKNRYGAYTGLQVTEFFFARDQLVTLDRTYDPGTGFGGTVQDKVGNSVDKGTASGAK